VVEDLKREWPNLKTFVTLSPEPGFASWLARERAADNSAALDAADKETLAALDQPGWINDPAIAERVKPVLLAAAAYYFLEAKDKRGRAADPVARFHLGNGARLEKLDYLGDTSAKGLKQSHGLMVNYCYDLDDIEANHEAFVEKGVIAASAVVRKRLHAKTGFNSGLSGAA
jgi:malonyl-CoA decarboxylase